MVRCGHTFSWARYVSLWGFRCQVGVATGDLAQGVLLFCSTWVSVFWGMDLPQSESVGQSAGECASVQVCV